MATGKTFEFIRLALLQLLMTALLISFLTPALWMVSSSLKVSTEVFNPNIWIPESLQWRNYLKLFELMPFGRFAWNTARIVFFAVGGTLVSSMMVAYSFARLRWPGRDFFFAILVSTMLLPDVVTLVPRFIIFKNLGWLNTFLPLTVPFWFGVTPVYIFLMRQFLRGIPMELEEAALIDGAGRMRILIQILVPLSKPVIATVAVFALFQHYTDFINPLIFINSMENWTIALGVAGLNANESFSSSWEIVFAAGTLMTLPVLSLFILAQRYFVQGITMTGFGGR